MSKRFIAWARVSSLRQKEEGWSLEHQEERMREFAGRNGGKIVKLYVVTETASKHQERETFQAMLRYARDNAAHLDGLLVMKIDRAARNMRDFVALEQLEEDYGVRLISITQPTETTPSGKMMRRTFATFATFFTEQLSVDVKAAMKRRAEAGLFVTLAPYGYRNVRQDNRRVVEVHGEESSKVQRIFQLYGYHNHTLDSLGDALAKEGLTYTAQRPRWTRSKLYELLTDRSYIGEVDHLGVWYLGTHEPIVDRPTFERVQDLLGRRSYRAHQMVYAGGLIQCGYCPHPISGEVKSKAGRQYTYYRCAKYNAPAHPRIRVPERELDRQLLELFDRMRIDNEGVREWLTDLLQARGRGVRMLAQEHRDRLSSELKRIRGQKDVLLNLRLNGEVDQAAYARKDQELRDREGMLQVELEAAGREPSEQAELAVRAFELSQNLRPKWLKAQTDEKRRILEIVCLNLRLDGASLVAEMRNPFDMLAEGAIQRISAQDRTPLERAERFIAGTLKLQPHIQSLIRHASIGMAVA